MFSFFGFAFYGYDSIRQQHRTDPKILQGTITRNREITKWSLRPFELRVDCERNSRPSTTAGPAFRCPAIGWRDPRSTTGSKWTTVRLHLHFYGIGIVTVRQCVPDTVNENKKEFPWDTHFNNVAVFSHVPVCGAIYRHESWFENITCWGLCCNSQSNCVDSTRAATCPDIPTGTQNSLIRSGYFSSSTQVSTWTSLEK